VPHVPRERGKPTTAFKNSSSIPGTNTEASLKTPVADKMLDYGLRLAQSHGENLL